MARRSEHTQDEIKVMILMAAEKIVAEEGLAKLKVRSIAMDIGYTVGSIYMIFDNMADLILHLKARVLDDIELHLRQVPSNLTPEEYLLNLSTTYIDFAQQHFNRWQMLFDPIQSTKSATPDWYRLKAMQLFQPVELQFNHLTPTATAEQVQCAAQALWGGVHGICWLSLTGSLAVVGGSDVKETVVLLVENFIRGWLSQCRY